MESAVCLREWVPCLMQQNSGRVRRLYMPAVGWEWWRVVCLS